MTCFFSHKSFIQFTYHLSFPTETESGKVAKTQEFENELPILVQAIQTTLETTTQLTSLRIRQYLVKVEYEDVFILETLKWVETIFSDLDNFCEQFSHLKDVSFSIFAHTQCCICRCQCGMRTKTFSSSIGALNQMNFTVMPTGVWCKVLEHMRNLGLSTTAY